MGTALARWRERHWHAEQIAKTTSAWRWPGLVLAFAFLATIAFMPQFTDAIDVGLPTGWLLFGFAAQALFTARLAVQWAASERAGKSVVNASFWWWSMAGGLMLGFYFAMRGDPVGYLGQLFGTLVYARNLWLIAVGRRWAIAGLVAMLASSVAAYYHLPQQEAHAGGLPWGWLAFGFAAQGLFTARMLLQWLASERAKASVVPVAFWWLSIAGGFCLGLYFIRRGDPVGVIGQLFGVVVYARNLWLMRANDDRVVVAERADDASESRREPPHASDRRPAIAGSR